MPDQADADTYPLAQVLWQLGEELRAVNSWGEHDGRQSVVEVTTASATMTLAISKDAGSGLTFGVLGMGLQAKGGLSRVSTTELTVNLKVREATGADGDVHPMLSYSPPPVDG